MTVSTFYSDASDGHIDCRHATYATARSGGGTFAVDTTNNGSSFKPWGQAFPYSAGVYGVAEDFFSFDTSSIPDTDVIDSVTFSLSIFTDATATVTNVCEVRLHDWGTSLTSADWVPGASLTSKTLLASKTSVPSGGRFANESRQVFTSEAAFIANVNKTGSTRVVVCTNRVAAGTVPTNDETIHPYFVEIGTTRRPELVVTYHEADTTVVLTQPSETGEALALDGVTEVVDITQVTADEFALPLVLQAVVGNFSATPTSSTQVDLSWDAFPGATGYDLERDGLVIAEFLPPTASFLDEGLTPDTEYTYRIRAVI